MASMGYVSKGTNYVRMSYTLTTARANLYISWYYRTAGSGSWTKYDQTPTTSTGTYYDKQYFGLASGTWYDFRVEVTQANGVYYDGQTYPNSIQTDTPPSAPASSPGISATSPSWNGTNFDVTVYYNSVAGATYYTFYANSGSGDVNKGSDTQNLGYFKMTLDSEQTTYRIKAVACNAYGCSAPASEVYPPVTTPAKPDTTPPSMLSFTVTTITANEATVYMRAVDYQSGLKRFCMTLDNNLIAYQTNINGSGEAYYTFTGLAVNRTYTFGAYAEDNASPSNQSSSLTQTKKTTYSRPSDWSWWSGVYQGGAVRITAAEWNAFTTRINLFRQWWDSVKNTNIGQVQFTQVNTGTRFTAAIFNQARNAISSMTTSGLTGAVVSGGRFAASSIDNLRAVLNSLQ